MKYMKTVRIQRLPTESIFHLKTDESSRSLNAINYKFDTVSQLTTNLKKTTAFVLVFHLDRRNIKAHPKWRPRQGFPAFCASYTHSPQLLIGSLHCVCLPRILKGILTDRT